MILVPTLGSGPFGKHRRWCAILLLAQGLTVAATVEALGVGPVHHRTMSVALWFSLFCSDARNGLSHFESMWFYGVFTFRM